VKRRGTACRAERLRALAPDERLALTARLAEWDLDLFASVEHTTREAAKRLLVRRRREGRRASAVCERAEE
jgi:hypothetical protein